MTSWISLFFSKSSVLGRPSASLGTLSTSRPASVSTAAVPVVELSLKPRSAKLLAKAATSALWASLTLMNTRPSSGSELPEAICDLA